MAAARNRRPTTRKRAPKMLTREIVFALRYGSGTEASVFVIVFGVAIAFGGVITGEHGIGLAKKRWWPQATSNVSREVHRAIKDALDPVGILNPGKFL